MNSVQLYRAIIQLVKQFSLTFLTSCCCLLLLNLGLQTLVMEVFVCLACHNITAAELWDFLGLFNSTDPPVVRKSYREPYHLKFLVSFYEVKENNYFKINNSKEVKPNQNVVKIVTDRDDFKGLSIIV